MKKILQFFFVILILTSCEDVIDLDLPTADPKLVVDASFNVFSGEDPIRVEGGVWLSLTVNFLNGEPTYVDNAQVSITDLDNGTVYPFSYTGNEGLYLPENINIIPEPDSEYQLTVIYNNETYQATASLIPTVPIDNITQGDGSLFGGDDTEIIVEFQDDPNRDDYYLFDLDFSEFITTDDEFYQGEKFVFSYFYDKLEAGQNVNVKINGLDEQFYDYIGLVLEQSGESSGGPFQTTPSTVRGNIVNLTNSENFALGYFSISETYNFPFTIN